MHKKARLAKHTSHLLYLPHNSTVVMLVLEPKVALNAFKPISVTLLSAVWVRQQSIRALTRSATHPTRKP